MKKENESWLKNRGYLHLTPQIDVKVAKSSLLKKIQNPNFISQHAFFPLIHSNVKERRYKYSSSTNSKAHSHEGKPTAKLRPLHYSTHIDALIFGYYASILQEKYEKKLLAIEGLSECVTAYRKIPNENRQGTFRSTIEFANDIFGKVRELGNDTVVLKFDIKSFFSSIDHKLLKTSWRNLLGKETLPADHYNVFKAATKFSYVLKDDLRLYKDTRKKAGFDEKKLSKIRKQGKISFLFTNSELKELLKEKKLRVHKYPFRREGTKEPIGIPQGLPISATLANLYLLNFDLEVLKDIVKRENVIYRRYSDDIVVICRLNNYNAIKNQIIELIKKSKVEISVEKTEVFVFKNSLLNKGKLISIKVEGTTQKLRHPFTYLGFEFNGEQILIKSANLAKFYRRMITTVKKRANRSLSIAKKSPYKKLFLHRSQLKKLYSDVSLDRKKVVTRRKRLVKNKYDEYIFESFPKIQKFRSNYFSYARRASKIMNAPEIERQLSKHKRIFNEAQSRALIKAKKKLFNF